MRLMLATLPLVALAACAPAPYEQVQGGVGFGDYGDYLSQRTAQAGQQRSAALPAQQPIVPPPADPNAAPSPSELAAAGISGAATLPQAATSYPQTAGAAPLPAPYPQAAVPAPTPVPAPAAASSPSAISDEQDFAAVSSRESIASDKARIEQNRAQYVQVQPGALPERPAEDTSVIVQYAINAQNRLGQSVYSRTGLSLSSHERACSRYASPEAAQEAFLKSGGPQRDPKNLDPDGDGFACRWDPTPFQTVRN